MKRDGTNFLNDYFPFKFAEFLANLLRFSLSLDLNSLDFHQISLDLIKYYAIKLF